MTCRNLCLRFTDIPEYKKDIMNYLRGYKRCPQCNILYRTVSVHCDCCGTKLSCKPASHKARNTLREIEALTKQGYTITSVKDLKEILVSA